MTKDWFSISWASWFSDIAGSTDSKECHTASSERQKRTKHALIERRQAHRTGPTKLAFLPRIFFILFTPTSKIVGVQQARELLFARAYAEAKACIAHVAGSQGWYAGRDEGRRRRRHQGYDKRRWKWSNLGWSRARAKLSSIRSLHAVRTWTRWPRRGVAAAASLVVKRGKCITKAKAFRSHSDRYWCVVSLSSRDHERARCLRMSCPQFLTISPHSR